MNLYAYVYECMVDTEQVITQSNICFQFSSYFGGNHGNKSFSGM